MNKKIGIIEICEPNHYSAVNGLMKTYSSEKTNHVYIFTVPKIANALKENGLHQNIELLVWDAEKEKITDFFKKMESYSLDRLHICTVTDFYKSFLNFKFPANEIYFHVHNISDWFDDSFRRLTELLIFDVRNNTENKPLYKKIGRYVLETAFNSRYRRRFLKKIRQKKYHYIVHSGGQKQFLSKFVSPDKITIFPFAIYENLQDNSGENTKLRICVPGIVSNSRRDYDSLFKAILDNINQLQNKILLDLLGFIPKNEIEEMTKKIKELEDKGIEVLSYFDFVYGEQYDSMLSKADILLNNQKVEKNPSQKYGVTKESGMLFNMIRGAKPGILPAAYPVDKEFHPAAIFFEDYEELGKRLAKIVADSSEIKEMKKNAILLSEKNSAINLYGLLIRV